MNARAMPARLEHHGMIGCAVIDLFEGEVCHHAREAEPVDAKVESVPRV